MSVSVDGAVLGPQVDSYGWKSGFVHAFCWTIAEGGGACQTDIGDDEGSDCDRMVYRVSAGGGKESDFI